MIDFECRTVIEAYADGGLNKWPESPPKPITWHNSTGIGSVSLQDIRNAMPYALLLIEQIPGCGARFAYTSNPKTANILIRQAKPGEGGMGKKGGVLADMMVVPPGLGSNDDFQATGRFDGAEKLTSKPKSYGEYVSFLQVAPHEIMHGLGCAHCPDDPKDLMYARLSNDTDGFREWSRREITKRYPMMPGLPAPGGGAPVPPPSTPEPTSGTAVIRLPGGTVIYAPKPVTIDKAVITYK